MDTLLHEKKLHNLFFGIGQPSSIKFCNMWMEENGGYEP